VRVDRVGKRDAAAHAEKENNFFTVLAHSCKMLR
jgi:hypothetical protein